MGVFKIQNGYIDGPIRIVDRRNETGLPKEYTEKTMSTLFMSSDGPTGSWVSGISMKGWTNDYTVWQLVGNSNTSSTSSPSLFYRYGINGSWNNWQTILSTANYSDYCLPLSTLTTGIHLKNNNIDFSQTNNGVSSYAYSPVICFNDKYNNKGGYIQNVAEPSGGVFTQFGTRNYDTDGNTLNTAYINLSVDKYGFARMAIGAQIYLTSQNFGSSLPTSGVGSNMLFFKIV